MPPVVPPINAPPGWDPERWGEIRDIIMARMNQLGMWAEHTSVTQVAQQIDKALPDNPVKAGLALRVWSAFAVAIRGASEAVMVGLRNMVAGAMCTARGVISVGVTAASELGKWLGGIATAVGELSLGEIAVAVICVVIVVYVLYSIVSFNKKLQEEGQQRMRTASILLDQNLPGPSFMRIQPGRVG